MTNENIYYCSKEELKEKSKIPFRVLPTQDDINEEIAQIMVDVITKNNSIGKQTVIICPVGPIWHYPIFAKKVNELNLSLKNCVFINMDEYLDDEGNLIAYENTLSFKKTMDEMLYSQIKEELLMPEENRIFPDPSCPEEMDKLIDSFEKIDCVLTGVGINGHIAFNEPPEKDEKITDEEFENIGTRCLDISRETIVRNGCGKYHGALDIFPKKCVTLGMKQLLKADMFKVYLYCDWQWGIMRKAALGEVTRFAPVTYLQKHKNAEMIVTNELYEMKI